MKIEAKYYFIDKFAKLVKQACTTCKSENFEEFKKGWYNTCHVPQDKNVIIDLLIGANKLCVYNKEVNITNTKNGDIKLTLSNYNGYTIVLNRYDSDDEYGKQGDLNYLDISQKVYDWLFKK